MNLRDLEYAEALARTRHFGEAASACNISQSTLSIQIKKLEEELGTKLFERDSRQVLLTDAGKDLLVDIKPILASHRGLKEKAAALQNPLAGTLRFGAFPTLAPYLLPHIMPPLHAALPNVHFHLVEEKTERLTQQLLDGALDAALIALPVADARLDVLPLFAEPFLLAVAADSPLASRKRITLDILKGQQLLLLDEGHCLRSQSLEVCARIGIGFPLQHCAANLAGRSCAQHPRYCKAPARIARHPFPVMHSCGPLWQTGEPYGPIYTPRAHQQPTARPVTETARK